MTKAEFQEPLPVVRLWVHECERVMSDRLVSDNDLAKFSEMRVDVIKKHFGNMPLVSKPRSTGIKALVCCWTPPLQCARAN